MKIIKDVSISLLFGSIIMTSLSYKVPNMTLKLLLHHRLYHNI